MQVEQDISEKLAATLYRVQHAGNPAEPFDGLPEERKRSYRAVVDVLLGEISGHVAALVRSIGEVAVEQERRARVYHADCMRAMAEREHVVELLREAAPFVNEAKWRYESGAAALADRMQRALGEATPEASLDSEER